MVFFSDTIIKKNLESILSKNIKRSVKINNLNVSYLSGISSLKADKAEIDILNKKTKIYMEDANKKVQIKNTSSNGNN